MSIAVPITAFDVCCLQDGLIRTGFGLWLTDEDWHSVKILIIMCKIVNPCNQSLRLGKNLRQFSAEGPSRIAIPTKLNRVAAQPLQQHVELIEILKRQHQIALKFAGARIDECLHAQNIAQTLFQRDEVGGLVGA